MSAMSWASRVENHRLPTRLICEHIIENRSRAGRSIIPPMSTAIPPRRRVARASRKDSAGAPGPTASMTMSTPFAVGVFSDPCRAGSPSPAGSTSMRSGAMALTSSSRSALRPVPRMRVTPRPSAIRQAPRPRVPEMPSIEDGAAGAGAGFAQRGVGGAEVAEAGALLEGHRVGQFDQVALGGGEVLGETTVGVGVELASARRPEREVAHEGVARGSSGPRRGGRPGMIRRTAPG